MKSIEKTLHEAGYKYTTPRRLVAQVIEQGHGHLSANEIWEAVKAIDTRIGRMSVYRTLDLYTQIGIIRPASRSSSDSRNSLVYVVMHDGHHHHIICQNCEKVIDFEDCGLHELVAQLETRYKCKIEGHLLEFFGICSACLAQQAE